MGLSVIALDFETTVVPVSNFLCKAYLVTNNDILVFSPLTLIISPYRVHMGLLSIEMGAGSGQLPLVCLHHPDINMQL